jgi:hypothetical protein
MLIDAAADGQGVALARTTLAAWNLIYEAVSDRGAFIEVLLDRLP